MRISLQNVLNLVIHWAIFTTQSVQAKMFGTNRNTVRHLQQKLRIVTNQALCKSDIILGGPGKIVEIDESLFVRAKHNRGKDLRRPQIWIFGLYERNADPKVPKRVLFSKVPKRGNSKFDRFEKKLYLLKMFYLDAKTLLSVIYKHVSPGTTIYSDCWAAYNKINQFDSDFVHHRVNHNLCFVHREAGRIVHTNPIESL
jgi:hypothetical protein